MVILTGSSLARSVSQFFTIIIIFGLVLFLTYVTTRYVGNIKRIQSRNKNFEVIETYSIATNKYLQIVRAADKYIVIAVGKDEITKIAELNEDSIIKEPQEYGQNDAFASIISKAKERINKGGNNE